MLKSSISSFALGRSPPPSPTNLQATNIGEGHDDGDDVERPSESESQVSLPDTQGTQVKLAVLCGARTMAS